MIITKITSSLTKAMRDSKIDDYTPLERISALKGERVSFQLLHTYIPEAGADVSAYPTLTLTGPLSKYATVREVKCVPIENSLLTNVSPEEDYISLEGGLFPDLLTPLPLGDRVCTTLGAIGSIWVEIAPPDAVYIEDSTLTLRLGWVGEFSESSVAVHFVNATLPDSGIYMTQWFHTDCLASYYGVKVFSERHWEIIESFARTAVRCGINMLLTPTLTPPLDTEVGGERLTTQLVKVTLSEGKYSFDFALLDRWIDMCDRVGIKYLEIAHLFTQWGAKHAPKVIATVGGEEKRIFGWETSATSPEYVAFLRAFISALLSHLKARGDDGRCFFHISDEPHGDQIEYYRKAKEAVSDLLRGYPIIDALSDYEFYKAGVVEKPVPCNDHIAPFIEGGVENIWTYYCCGQTKRVSNRLTAMPSRRNRSIGMQMYKYNIRGFLHWDYNFYNSKHSLAPINPYLVQDGIGWVPPGDAFSVYPAPDGTAYESIRIAVFYEALQDLAALKLCESLCGREATVATVDEVMGVDVTFDTCAKSDDVILTLRRRINEMIEEKIK